MIPVPGAGMQLVQPIAAEDVGAAVVAALNLPEPMHDVLELVGPDVLPLRDYLLAWRRWLGFAPPLIFRTPRGLTRLAAIYGEHFGDGPIGQTMTRMLERGNIGSHGAAARLTQVLGIAPRSLSRALAEAPSHV
ncbi:MAG: hypothetical protein WDW38_000258 [Sanguina aurantia]